jgi:ABC-type sugar transport system ATPase subunit
MTNSTAADLVIEHVSKDFPDGTRALDDVSLEARAGRVLALLGPSGCGKSTLLRIVAGLEQATAGRVRLGGETLDDVPPGRRGVGFVFQNYALYPHLTVRGNLGLALETAGVERAEVTRRVERTAAWLGIDDLLARRPGQLSGGQQQRVALGRALAREPRLYLLDEPLSNLDAMLREGMRAELRTLFDRVRATVIYVTHDQTEAMSLADDVAVLRGGRVLQVAAPLDLYRRPADSFVARFVGSPRITLWSGRRSGGQLDCGGARVTLPEGLGGGDSLEVGIRPEDVVLARGALDGGWPGRRVRVEPLGAHDLVTFAVGDLECRALAVPGAHDESMWLCWPPECRHWFDAANGRRLETVRGGAHA